MSSVLALPRRVLTVALASALPWLPGTPALALEPCRLPGVERAVQCGQLEMPENPDVPEGRRIAIRYAVVPAVAKNKAPDPLFVFAGGPGQSATRAAGQLQSALATVNARRDIVYVDQRGTGGSHALTCAPADPARPLADTIDPARAVANLGACLAQLPADPAQYATWIAVRDIDAVRQALGVDQINLWGASYGTRAALEYLRQFPRQVRSVVLDGVAPADMALPTSFAVDAEAALQTLLAQCRRDAACARQHPRLTEDLDALLATAARGERVRVTHPLTGAAETLRVDRALLGGLLRLPLYAPVLAAVLPHALLRASQGDWAALLALNSALVAGSERDFALAMHFAVVCAEDLPRVGAADRAAAAATRFGTALLDLYERACRQVAVRPVPPAFYAPPTAPVPVLLLSGAADPVTPPRHGAAIARSLPNARHLVAPHTGHGVTARACVPDLIARFVRAADFTDERGRPIDDTCLRKLPAQPLFQAPATAAARS